MTQKLLRIKLERFRYFELEEFLDNGNFIRVDSIESAIDGSYAVIITE